MRGEGTQGHLDLVLLGVLAAGPGHGYAIITTLKQRSDGVLALPEGSVYPALHRLEEMGMVSSDWAEAGGRPPCTRSGPNGRGFRPLSMPYWLGCRPGW
jgi:PadR family transcriptional regulator PadR